MQVRRQRFPKRMRVRLRTDFQAVRRQGQSVRDGVLRINYVKREAEDNRLGLAISRRMGGAVQRNRIKRVIREVYRQDRASYSPGLDLVISAIDARRASDLREVRRSLQHLLRRIRPQRQAAR